MLGYCNERQDIRVRVEEDCKKALSDLLATASEGRLPDNPPESWRQPDNPLDANAKKSFFINDVGLYSLTLSSQKPEAKAFRRWVTSEVLPSIMKTGSYAVPTTTATATANYQHRNPKRRLQEGPLL